jgi:hypothetical protein
MPVPPRVFISYRHDVEPDQSVVDQVVRALEPHHTIFIDKKSYPVWSGEMDSRHMVETVKEALGHAYWIDTRKFW